MVVRYSHVGGVYYWYVSKICQKTYKYSFALHINNKIIKFIGFPLNWFLKTNYNPC